MTAYPAFVRGIAAIIPALLLGATSPAAAQQSISARDKAAGAEADPELRAQYGGAMRGPQADYVARVGKRVAVQSGLSNAAGDFTVVLLNSPVENAFAIPGGYVYVTRQLLALMNSEAELGSVLGHEVGHVAARHSAKRSTRSTIGSILAAGVGVLTGSDLLGQAAGYGAQLYTLGFSRSQEFEADGLGVRYIRAAGYTPYAAADMLESLDLETRLQARIEGRDADATPGWASTHPNGPDRVDRALKLAEQGGTPPPPADVQDTAYLRMLEGLPYDDDPAQGVADGQRFRHPVLRFTFTAPPGYAIANGADAVVVKGAGGQARFDVASSGASPAQAVREAFAAVSKDRGALPDGAVRTGRINGLETAQATVQASSNGRAVDATVVAYRFPGAVYRFLVVTPAGEGLGALAPLVDSLRPLSQQEAAQVRGKRVRIVTVKPGDTVASLAARMAYPSFREERFTVLNGLVEGRPLRPGQLVKIIAAE